jgi:hypothetical protein
MTPLVSLIRRLSSPDLATYEQVVSAVEADGYERINLPALPGRDGIEFTTSDSFKGHGMIVLLQESTATECGRKWSGTSVSVIDKSAPYAKVVEEISAWLGADPEYPARAAQFFIVETAESRIPISLAESSAWYHNPIGGLAHITVGNEMGVSVSRIVSRPV